MPVLNFIKETSHISLPVGLGAATVSGLTSHFAFQADPVVTGIAAVITGIFCGLASKIGLLAWAFGDFNETGDRNYLFRAGIITTAIAGAGAAVNCGTLYACDMLRPLFA